MRGEIIKCDVCGTAIGEHSGLVVSHCRIEKLNAQHLGSIPTVEVCGPVCYFKLFTRTAYPDLSPNRQEAQPAITG